MEHVHRWSIDSPAGATSIGRCDCGAEREFANYYGEREGEGTKFDRYAWNAQGLKQNFPNRLARG